jgi:hypothetical protein
MPVAAILPKRIGAGPSVQAGSLNNCRAGAGARCTERQARWRRRPAGGCQWPLAVGIRDAPRGSGSRCVGRSGRPVS